MDRVFSVDDMSEHLWSPDQPKMNRSSSEWAFQRFLQEAEEQATTTTDRDEQDDVVEIKGNDSMKSHDRGEDGGGGGNDNINNHKRGPPQHRPPRDSGEYQAFLKSQLDLACAAVALSRSGNSEPQDSTPTPSKKEPLHGYKASELDKEGSRGPVQLPSAPAASLNHFVQVKSATSDSSGDQSDEDEVEGESEIMDPTDAKRVRRMLSNRESARRSRRRKQAHLTELETQVAQLRVENSSLHKRLTGISQKYNEAAVDNRVLKADVETLRAKVKMAEETVKRVTGLNPLFQAMSEISSTMAMPSFASNSSDSSGDAAVPARDGPNQKYYLRQSNTNNNSNNNNSTNNSGLSAEKHRTQENAQGNASVNKMGRRVSMQRVASLEHLQKRIRGEVSSLATHGSREK